LAQKRYVSLADRRANVAVAGEALCLRKERRGGFIQADLFAEDHPVMLFRAVLTFKCRQKKRRQPVEHEADKDGEYADDHVLQPQYGPGLARGRRYRHALRQKLPEPFHYPVNQRGQPALFLVTRFLKLLACQYLAQLLFLFVFGGPGLAASLQTIGNAAEPFVDIDQYLGTPLRGFTGDVLVDT